ncbi:hypothetical protein SADUNF_Sadunf07G0053600 [Salix dunnii]|uniref:Clp1 C-terminal domain-containing protein n=1 Tax=Salix dunnii TaxID=1413687 RepID=A0A835MTT7_9ROSI|nr:hypothetical protein SADUNF_Sadunf07G0053600 [Salix dunnii]
MLTRLPQPPRSALPIGADPVANPLPVAPVNIDQDLLHVVLSYTKEPDQIVSSKSVMKDNIDQDLLHVVLAVSFAQEPDQIVSSNVAGFIYVRDIDLQRLDFVAAGCFIL